MIEYMVKQLKEEVIPKLERISGVKFDIDRLREYLKKSAAAEDDLVRVLQSAKTKPSPIDAYFGGIYYIGPIFGAFRGTDDAIEYYKFLRAEVEERLAAGKGPVTPDGDMGKEKYRLVVEGPPNYTNFRQFWKMFYDEGAVVVASSYTKVGGVYDLGFRHDPDKPLETLAEYCLGVYTNRSLPMRIDMLANYVRGVRRRRPADQLDQELQQLLGRPAADHARGGEAHRQAGGVRRIRSRRSALFLGRQHQEPARELFPDDRAEARRRARRRLRSRTP